MPATKQTFKQSVTDVDWTMTLMGVLALVLTWSSVSLEYAATIATSSIHPSWGFLFAYQVGIALSALLLFNHHFHNVWATAGLLVAVCAAGGSIHHGGTAIGLLMILFPVFFILLSSRASGLQSGYGLSIYSLLASTCAPLSFIKLSTGFLSWEAVAYVIPLFLSFLFFTGPSFLQHSQWSVLIETASGLALIIAILIRGISLAHFLAVGVVLAGWLLVINQKRPVDGFLADAVAQMICVLLMYWH